MVRLKKIKRADGFIEAYYTPEDSSEEGYIKIRLSDGEVVEQKMTSFDEKIGMYFVHARKGLQEMAKEETISSERLIMWY